MLFTQQSSDAIPPRERLLEYLISSSCEQNMLTVLTILLIFSLFHFSKNQAVSLGYRLAVQKIVFCFLFFFLLYQNKQLLIQTKVYMGRKFNTLSNTGLHIQKSHHFHYDLCERCSPTYTLYTFTTANVSARIILICAGIEC